MLTILFRHSQVVMIATMLVIVGCSSKEKENRLRKASIHFGAGTQSLMAQKYTEALISLKTANKLDPKNPEILINLGMAYYFKGERDTAIKLLNESIKLKEENSDARINLASIYYKDGDYARAEKMYKEILKDLTYDKQARTFYNLGILELEVKKNSVAAEKYFKSAVKEDDNYCPAYYQLGLIAYKRRQFTSSLKNFREATMGVCTDSPGAHYYQGLNLIELKRYTDARLKFDEIDSRFKKSVYAVKARTKSLEINEIENSQKTNDSHASRVIDEESEF